jgi:hypothetical protein
MTRSFIFAVLVTVAPLGAYFIQHPTDFIGRASQVSILASSTPILDLVSNTIQTLGMFNVQGDANQRHNISGSPELFWPVGLCFILGITLCIVRPQKQSSVTILFAGFFLAFLPVIFSNEAIPHALRSILLIPPTMIFAAIGASWVYDELSPRVHPVVAQTFVAAFALVLLVHVSYSYFVVWANDPRTAASFSMADVVLANQIRNLPNDIPKYIVVAPYGVFARGIPVHAQTVQFLTNTFTSEQQHLKNTHYVFPSERQRIPKGATIFSLP